MAEEPGEDTSPVRVVYMFYDTVGRRPVCLDAEVYHDEVKKCSGHVVLEDTSLRRAHAP